MAKTPSKSSSKSSTKAAAKTTAKSKSTVRTKTKSLRSKTKAVSTRPTAARKTTAKPKLVAVESPKSTEAPRKELTKKDLIERIVTESGMKKGEVRTALDATLTVLRQALREGSDIAAAPLGKLKIAREKETPNGKLVVCRVKLKDPTPTGSKDPFAKPAE